MANRKLSFKELEEQGMGVLLDFETLDDLTDNILQKGILGKALVIFFHNDYYFNVLKTGNCHPDLETISFYTKFLGVPINNGSEVPIGSAWIKFNT